MTFAEFYDLKSIKVNVPTHLATAITSLLADPRSGFKRANDISEVTGVSQSTLSRIMSSDRRPDVVTLRALCTKLNLEDGLSLLCAHLRDEVTRSGRKQSEVTIESGAIATDLQLLVDESSIDPDLRSLLSDLARMIRHKRTEDRMRIAAEDRSPYPSDENPSSQP